MDARDYSTRPESIIHTLWQYGTRGSDSWITARTLHSHLTGNKEFDCAVLAETLEEFAKRDFAWRVEAIPTCTIRFFMALALLYFVGWSFGLNYTQRNWQTGCLTIAALLISAAVAGMTWLWSSMKKTLQYLEEIRSQSPKKLH